MFSRGAFPLDRVRLLTAPFVRAWKIDVGWGWWSGLVWGGLGGVCGFLWLLEVAFGCSVGVGGDLPVAG